jgi:hypothetical protein
VCTRPFLLPLKGPGNEASGICALQSSSVQIKCALALPTGYVVLHRVGETLESIEFGWYWNFEYLVPWTWSF